MTSFLPAGLTDSRTHPNTNTNNWTQPTTDLAATNVGTPYYMSPELVNHQAYAEGADMWSVGCLLVRTRLAGLWVR